MIQSKYLKQPDWLYFQYYKKNLSTLQIGKICGCGKDTVCRWMEKLGIKRRTFAEARSFRFLDRKYRNRDWLYRKYWLQDYGMKRLADLCGVSRSTIRTWLKRHSIEIRNPLEGYLLQYRTPEKPPYGSFPNRLILIARDLVKSFRKYF